MSRTELNACRWLDAHLDRSAGLQTLPGGLVLADLAGDGDHRLVLADLCLKTDARSRLKVYRGTVLASDQVLSDIPSCLISFYTDSSEQKIPAIGVCCGSQLLLYKNSKPYFKYTIPLLPVSALEREIWRKAQNDPDPERIVKDLETVPYNILSAKSQHLLSLPKEQLVDAVIKYTDVEPTKTSPITCATTIYKTSTDKQSVSCPVLATEAGHIYVIDPKGFSVLHQASVCNTKATPYMVKATGLFEVDFRIIIACRENTVCVLRRGWLEGKIIFQTTANIVDVLIIPGENFIVVATDDKHLHCYTKRGHRLWTVEMVNKITCLCLVPLEHLSANLMAVGLRGGLLHLYQGRYPVDYVSVPDTPVAITFGQLGQEEHVMVVVTSAGAINFKILKRHVDFKLNGQDSNSAPINQSKPLPLPKRSKLFIEQSIREKQNAIEMHQNFQQDLIRLRLAAANALVQNLASHTGAGNNREQVKLSAQILGLGPKFTLTLTVENMNADKALVGLFAVFNAKVSIYKLSTYSVSIPLVPPGLSYKVEIKVLCLQNNVNVEEEENSDKDIRVFVVKNDQKQPLVAATINMPPADLITY